MTTQLYTVTVTDLGTYEVLVAADTPAEAQSIAKTVLFDEAVAPTQGMRIVKREADAKAEPATDLPIRKFQVSSTYTIEFSMLVPASDSAEAERHARRFYDENGSPFEFQMDDERVGPFRAREVVS